MSKYAIVSLLTVSSIALLGAGCQSTTTSTNNQNANNAATETTNVNAPATVTVPVDTETPDATNTSDATDTAPADETNSNVSAGAQNATISTSGNTFSPATVTIQAGDSVEFNLEAAHNVVQVSQATWDANQVTPLSSGFSVGYGGHVVMGFDTPGTYYYVCQPHASLGMKGKIVVQ